MNSTRTSLPLIGVTVIALSTLTLISTPAQAADSQTGVGSGRAVIRIDASEANVKKTGKHSYRMILPEISTGQWMGERANVNGKLRTRVGDLTAGKLAKRWTNFRYGKAPVYTTLLWKTKSSAPGTAVVMLSQPKITDEGVRFDFTSRFEIPKVLSDVSINIARAPGADRSTRGNGVQDATVSGTLVVWISVSGPPQVAYGRIFDSSGKDCWGGSVGTPLASFQSVDSGTCAGFDYTNAVTTNSPSGVVTDYSAKPDKSTVLYQLELAPATGGTSFVYNHTFYF